MIYEAWEIRELITNFAYEGNEKRKRERESEEKIVRERDDNVKPSRAIRLCVRATSAYV